MNPRHVVQLHVRFITDKDPDDMARTLRQVGHMLVADHGIQSDIWTSIRVITENER